MKSKRKFRRKRRAALSARLAVQALLAGAAAIPTLAGPSTCVALGPSQLTETRFAYMSYRDWQAGDEDRIKVHAPMAWVRTPVGEHTELEGSFVLDGVSGASPLYHDTLSGASGRGIEDERTAANISATHYFDDFGVTVGLSTSSEDDYESNAGSLEFRYWTPDNNTIVQLGVSTADDSISSTNNPDLDESQRSFGVGASVTQVIDKNSVIQSNLVFGSEDGYLSDPYKSFDLRPRSRDQVAWLNRYVLYLPDQESSLHFDYRLYSDSWSVNAHTFELQYYQPLGTVWMLRPRLRYYTQDKSQFYSKIFPPDEPGSGFFTADQRMSGFGSISAGLRIERQLAQQVYASLSFDYIRQQGSFKAFSPGSPGLEPFSAAILGVGFYVSF